jgi:hypothetical protein
MIFGPRPDFDFLHMNYGLVLFGFLAALILLVFVFPVIHDPADRRRSSRRDLNQIQALFFGEPDGLLDGQYPDLLSVGIDDPHFRCSDLPVNVGFLNYTIHLPWYISNANIETRNKRNPKKKYQNKNP